MKLLVEFLKTIGSPCLAIRLSDNEPEMTDTYIAHH